MCWSVAGALLSGIMPRECCDAARAGKWHMLGFAASHPPWPGSSLLAARRVKPVRRRLCGAVAWRMAPLPSLVPTGRTALHVVLQKMPATHDGPPMPPALTPWWAGALPGRRQRRRRRSEQVQPRAKSAAGRRLRRRRRRLARPCRIGRLRTQGDSQNQAPQPAHRPPSAQAWTCWLRRPALLRAVLFAAHA
jgi:hypothetical protein